MKNQEDRAIRVSSCVLGEEECTALIGCVRDNWITMGPRVREFEGLFAAFCGVDHAVAVNNGTAAMHLALLGIGVSKGDEVIVPDLTYIATVNAVHYCGAQPVLCEVEKDTWCIDVTAAERLVTPRTKAIVAVHLYGHPCDMRGLQELCARHGIALVEDAAEAHGAEWCGKKTGGLGDVAAFSFYGNKLMTTGEGGMCTTGSAEIAERMRLYRGQGVDPERSYWHPVIGYNYRMTDLQGALGCAQIHRLDGVVSKRRSLSAAYTEKLNEQGLILPYEAEFAKHVYWLYAISIPGIGYCERDEIMRCLSLKGIETRPWFYPVHQLPPYQAVGCDEDFPVSVGLSRGGICLPSHDGLTAADVSYVAETLLVVITEILHESSRLQ